MEPIYDACSREKDAKAVREAIGENKKYHIVTYGCQMNVRDGETAAGLLEEMGFSKAQSREEADIVLFETCCVRENAENRALGNVIWLKELKKTKPDLLIAVGGCMTQEEGMAERIRRQYPFVDIVFGTHNLYRLTHFVREAVEGRRAIEILPEGGLQEGLPAKRNSSFSAFVNIMYGCNNFCSYCIVPYVRGRERSRSAQDILDEAKRLQDAGVREITLLGQNVNSYQGGGAEFANLLAKLDALGIERIRFMTSHPKDLSDELIAAYGSLRHLCGHLHLPVQSGSNRILEMMNRRYTREKYLDLVKRLRAVRPEIGLTSDIIVGFPGETEQDFQDTMSLAREVRYDSAFTFIYSPRPGTKAAAMPDGTPAEEKVRRIEELIALQLANTAEMLRAQIGRTETVLVESASERDQGSVMGKTGRFLAVNFPGKEDLIGKFVDVRITGAGKNTLRGEML
ncbi:MAG: tRNA (N6-isopentenyl adenosine(37)-C2)-methylthiotransferase MiaB [Eubacteriales bacterium]|nr:tRNA (N6-isopentenyl adenosine(37)-C2)-methylthiotransferase MiaB [Eubacteriales bacterium]